MLNQNSTLLYKFVDVIKLSLHSLFDMNGLKTIKGTFGTNDINILIDTCATQYYELGLLTTKPSHNDIITNKGTIIE